MLIVMRAFRYGIAQGIYTGMVTQVIKVECLLTKVLQKAYSGPIPPSSHLGLLCLVCAGKFISF